MALITCRECKSQISSTAKACPSCGAEPPKSTSTLAVVIAGIFGLIVFSVIYNASNKQHITNNSSTLPPKDPHFALVLIGAKTLKQGVKNPDSFKLISALRTTDGTVCYQFRATNSFNATVPGHFVLLPQRGSAEDKDWLIHCAGQTGTDYSYIKSVL